MAARLLNSFTLIDAYGNFNGGIQRDLNLDNEVSPLAVVSIIGAQSSGKSTLLNHMFGTRFEEFDARNERTRHRTTKGIWVAKKSLERGCILVVDTEGSDGQEREGNDTFARQTALFALAVSRVVIINMMCTDVGRESGAGWPLLRAACEVLQRFSTAHEVTLLFVLRDKTDSPLDALKSQIRDEMNKILNRMTGPQAQANARLNHLFKIKVVATSYYLVDSQRPNFIAEVHELRDWIISQTTSIQNTSECIPTSSFTTYAQEIWDKIKKQKELDLPTYRIMAAQVHCDRIAKDQCDSFCKDKNWLQIKEKVDSGSIVQGFGKKGSNLISIYLSQYEKNSINHDKTTRDKCGKRLTVELLEIIKPTYDCLADLMRSKKLEDFRKAALDELKNKGRLEAVEAQNFITEFDYQLKDAYIKQANWTNASTQRETLLSAMNLFVDGTNAMNARLDELKIDRKSMWIKIAQGLSIGVGLMTIVLASVLMPALSAAGVPAVIVPLVLKIFGL